MKLVNDVALAGLLTDVKLGLVALAGLVGLVRLVREVTLAREVFDVNEALDLAERLPNLLVAERVALDIVADITAGDLITLFDMILGLVVLLVVLDDNI